MTMNIEQLRAEFEAWYEKQMGEAPRIAEDMYTPFATACWEAYQAGRAALQSKDREDALIVAMQEAVDLLGPNAPSCCGCEYEWNHALRVLREAIDHAGRVEGDK